VAQISGVTVRETVPDSVLDRANEVELIDLPPDDLLQRLREGKVYMPAQAESAMQNFFRKGNLIALRELALRRTAERVDAEMESYRRDEGIAEPWAVRERILVCIGDPDMGLRLVRSARRMVTGLRAHWIVAHVETPVELRWPQARRDYIVDVLGFAQDQGAETVTLQGIRVADEILALAQQRNVSRILVGKPSRPRWRQIVEGSVVESLVHGSREMDVYVISGEAEGESPSRGTALASSVGWTHYVQAVGVVGVATGFSFIMDRYLEPPNLVMIYLLGVMLVALFVGRRPAVIASVLSVAAFDFFFVPPRFTFAVSDTQYVVTFAVMLVAALALSTMAHWLRVQTEAARRRELRTAALYRLGRELAALRTTDELLTAATRLVGEEFGGRVALLLPDANGRLHLQAGDLGSAQLERHEAGVAQWAFDNGLPAGIGTDTLPAARGVYLPLIGSSGPIGVLGLGRGPGEALRPDQFRFLEAVSNQTALAIERSQLADQAEGTRIQVESERLKNALLSSVSHDIRTPLAAITGAATSLLADSIPEETRRDLTTTIAEEAQRLSHQVGNLLEMTRLESGPIEVRKQWHLLEESVGATLQRLESRLAGREIRVHVGAAPMVSYDEVMIGQVLFNLVENALEYTPAGSPIEIRAGRDATGVWLEVADRGPGFPPDTQTHVFEKFYRGPHASGTRGIGLGLAICRSLIQAHGGRIEAANRSGGGAILRFWLPLEGEPPSLEPEAPGEIAAPSPAESPPATRSAGLRSD